MKKIVFIALSLISFGLVSQTLTTQNQEWVVSASTVKFKIKNAGFNIDGTFGGLTAKIIFDTSKGYGNSIDATIDSKSVNTGNGTRDGHLKKTEYFDIVSFPILNMKTNLIAKEKDGSFKGYFKLTIKRKTKDVLVPFTFTEKDGKAIIKGSFIINRLDFGVGESSMILSDNATITIEVNAIKK
jgi:polyisoprenoid-binding protein YceI